MVRLKQMSAAGTDDSASDTPASTEVSQEQEKHYRGRSVSAHYFWKLYGNAVMRVGGE